jgi:hypothetical protein
MHWMMREVILYFPDNILLEAYMRFSKVCCVQSSLINHSLTGYLTETQIVAALLYYEGELSVIKPVRSLFM